MKLEELARLKFVGGRSVEHGLEVSALRAIIQFEVLLNEAASFIRRGHADDAVGLRAKDAKIEIYLRHFQPGSTIVPLEVSADTLKSDEVERSLDLIARVFGSLAQREQLPEIPRSLALEFRNFIRSINRNESLQVTGRWNTSFPVARSFAKPLGTYLKRKNRHEPELFDVYKDKKQLRPGGIEATLQAIASEVPKEEWQRLPSDLTDDLDHYLYGTPKK